MEYRLYGRGSVFLAGECFSLPLRGREIKRKSCHCVATEIKRMGWFLEDLEGLEGLDRPCGAVLEELDVLVDNRGL